MTAICIRTSTGWVPLWRMSPPARPPFPIARESRPSDEAWRDEQHALLMSLHNPKD